ncbi:hypothetical protein M9H77_20809 [Catharanthus roseus]|uniref:Uncharacterized protein n=1 Tax=Catharanthus roseus TaxID=4058 RepID=A0ACC0APS4_CATRO|nr:hypothetical protein M9H77_20809 [Catharanthus roseus]
MKRYSAVVLGSLWDTTSLLSNRVDAEFERKNRKLSENGAREKLYRLTHNKQATEGTEGSRLRDPRPGSSFCFGASKQELPQAQIPIGPNQRSLGQQNSRSKTGSKAFHPTKEAEMVISRISQVEAESSAGEGSKVVAANPSVGPTHPEENLKSIHLMQMKLYNRLNFQDNKSVQMDWRIPWKKLRFQLAFWRVLNSSAEISFREMKMKKYGSPMKQRNTLARVSHIWKGILTGTQSIFEAACTDRG